VFVKSFDCLALRGTMVSYGQASGAPAAFTLALLAPKSAFLTRPTLFQHVDTRPRLEANSGDVFEVVSKGIVKIKPPIEFALKDAVAAHQALEGRTTTGSLVLLP
jgi:NADPH2:quinone reductase